MGIEDLEEGYRKDQKQIRELASLVLEIASYHSEYTTYSLLEKVGKSDINCTNREWSEARNGLRDSIIKAEEIIKKLREEYP